MDYVLSPPRGVAALKRLDDLIAAASGSTDGNCTLLLEHLHGARTYLLGAMPEEYAFSLASAKEAAAAVSDKTLQKMETEGVTSLLEDLEATREGHPTAPPPARRTEQRTEDEGKSELYRFFHGPSTTLGVFYPTHYIFASFPSLQNARDAARTLKAAGYQEVLAVSAADTIQFMKEIQAEVGVWGALMAAFSRFLGTEEVFADIDVNKAEKGAGFLAVYSPRDEHAEKIRDLVTPFEPLTMQWYLPGGVQSLQAGPSPGPQGIHPENT